MAYELLSGLSPAEVDQVLALGTRVMVPSGGPLFRLGDAADRLFLTERGRIRLTLPMLVRGREEDILIEEKSPGETVGWSALVPPYRFTLSATAPLETEVIALVTGGALRLLRYLASGRLQNRHELWPSWWDNVCNWSRQCGCARCSARLN